MSYRAHARWILPVLVLPFVCAPLPSHAAPPRPNIILAMADDLGWGDPSYNGGWINTPNLDTMAGSGLRFDRFYAACAVCSPTRASCLTGRNPFRVGVPTANQGHLGRDETPLSEVLDNAGYTCGHFGKWHLGTLTTLTQDSNRGGPGSVAHYSAPWHHQYDTCFATEAKVPTYHPMRKSQNGLPEPADFADANFYGTRYWMPPLDPAAWTNTSGEGVAAAVTSNVSGDDSRVMMDRVIPFVQSAVASNQPFFAVVWFHTPHKPLTDPEQVSGVDSTDAYTDAVRNMDTQLGRLRAELDTLGVRTNTMLWFCSDNGPENGVGQSGGLRARKRSLHEGGVRVPGILEWPATVTAARTTDYPCVTSDYYPTILDALQLAVTNQKPIDGISLMPVITNITDTLTRTHAIGFRFENSRSWVTQQHKLITKDSGATYELYDLLADIAETADIAASEPALAARLQFELETWLAAVAADTEYISPGEPSGDRQVIANGDFEQAVTPYADGNGGVLLKLDISNNVIAAASPSAVTGSDTGLDANEWVLTTLSRGFAFSAAGGNPGGAMDQNSQSDGNGKGRAFLQFVADGRTAKGEYGLTADVLLNERNTANQPLAFQLEVYGWQSDTTEYAFAPGAPSAGLFNFEDNGGSVSNLVVLLKETVTATTNAAWRNVIFTSLDFSEGYDYLAVRVAVANQDPDAGSGADLFAVDNLRFVPVAGAVQTTIVSLAGCETVDSEGDIPADDDNNLDKFDVGGAAAAEFTTRLYVRSSTSAGDRRVRAFASFDLAGLSSAAVTRATLEFRGFSLNDTGSNDLDLHVSRLTEGWASAADPYRPAVVDTVNAGSVITPGAPTSGRDFAVDVTPIVSAWIGAAATNHGFFLQPASMDVNNGLGIKTNGTGALRLVIRQALLDADGDGMDDAWETEHFGSPTHSSGAAVDDWDGDGFIDLFEFRAGTNPTNPASLLALTRAEPSALADDLVIAWQSVAGKSYSLLSTTHAAAPVWVTNATGIRSAAPQCVHTMVVERPAGFVRVRVE